MIIGCYWSAFVTVSNALDLVYEWTFRDRFLAFVLARLHGGMVHTQGINGVLLRAFVEYDGVMRKYSFYGNQDGTYA